jgi:pimeloyl-ACP methyl ester carboxylesterase
MDHAGLHVVRHHADAPGPPVVLVHGAPDRGKNFAHVVHRLGDLPVTVYDRRGYGRSIDAAIAADGRVIGGFGAHADDLIELLGGVPSVVCGQSAGGTIAMLAAAEAPDLFAALGVWEPPMVPYEWWVGEEAMERTMAWARYDDPLQLGEDMNRSILGDDRWEELRDATREMLRNEGAAFRADMASQAAPLFDPDVLEVPIVVGWGTEAPEQFIAANRRLAERVGAEQYVADGADHFAHLGHPDAWAGLVRRTVDVALRSAVGS